MKAELGRQSIRSFKTRSFTQVFSKANKVQSSELNNSKNEDRIFPKANFE